MNTITDVSLNGVQEVVNEASPFIEANTEKVELQELAEEQIIPVYVKDNEPLISHAEFIDLAIGVTHHILEGELIEEPDIRVSHPVKGRIPEAKGKPADQLEEHEKTIYSQRMAFVIRIPSITKEVNGNSISLVVGGIKSYHEDNLNRTKGAPEHFRIFVGFLNKVCTNLCIWNEGYSKLITVNNTRSLESEIYHLVRDFNYSVLPDMFSELGSFELQEHQFAQLIGRARLYQYLPRSKKQQLPELLLNDTQIAMIAKEFYKNKEFGCQSDGSIDLWSLYNLFTEANKSSYIDTFLDRGVNAYSFIKGLAESVQTQGDFWFIK